MDTKKYEETLNTIQEKIGNDASNLILDDIAVLLNDNKQMNDELVNRENTIKNLEKTRDTLQQVNGNLLQQVAMAPEPIKQLEDDTPKIIDFRTSFDEKGNFKR